MGAMKAAPTAALAVSAVVMIASGVLVSCASSPSTTGDSISETPPAPSGTAPATALLYNTAPQDGTPLFVGFSSRLRDRDEEEGVAILDAAAEAVRYLEVGVSVIFISRQSGRSAGYAEAVQTRIDEGRVKQVREGLEVIDSHRDGRGTVVVVAAPELTGISLPREAAPEGRTPPTWIDARPRIPGYDVGVGVAGRRRNRSDSVTAADEEALADIVLQRAARVRAVGDSRSIEGVGTAEQTTRAQEAADIVRGFYVLSRWRSSDGRYYYSLAVARRKTEATGE